MSGADALVAEVIGWHVGRWLGVPIPDAAIFAEPGGSSWCSAVVPDVMHWDVAHLMDIENVDALGALMALDVVTMEVDRHAGNLLIGVESGRMALWVIDQGAGRLGERSWFGQVGMATPAPSPIFRQLPADLVLEPSLAAAALATQITIDEARSIAADAYGALNQRPPAGLAELLHRRCAAAPAMVMKFLSEIG